MDMSDIPFRTFDGFLKQHAHAQLPPPEQALFDILFPAFQGDDDAESAYQSAKNGELARIMEQLIEFVPGERRMRRFAGHDLPRQRYYTVARDGDGDDGMTLAHELRAYRNPVRLGMVEVIDLAQGCVLGFASGNVKLQPERALAVLVHNADRLPPQLRTLGFRELPPVNQRPIHMFKFPYKVESVRIDKTIDLRFPEVRDWFFRTFREPSRSTLGYIPDGRFGDATIAHSRFHLEDGKAPTPADFWKMLPTLMNPDTGGGKPSSTGSTILWLAHWMRQNGVEALVYPSARCDVLALFEDGELADFKGWNLVHYRESPLMGGAAEVITFDPSPWAWLDFPQGVELGHSSKGSQAGSFVIGGMVNYWAGDYIDQVKALDLARATHGDEPPADTSAEAIALRAFLIGALAFRWLRFLATRRSSEEVTDCVLELQGLALPYRLYDLTGRIRELWKSMVEGRADFGAALMGAMEVVEAVAGSCSHRYQDSGVDCLVRLGGEIELLMLLAAGCLASGGSPQPRGVPTMMSNDHLPATRWLDENVTAGVNSFLNSTRDELRHGSCGASTLSNGENLVKSICAALV